MIRSLALMSAVGIALVSSAIAARPSTDATVPTDAVPPPPSESATQKSRNATPIATTALSAILYGATSANTGERLFGQKCAFCHIGPSTGTFMLGRRMPKDQAELPSRTDLPADYVKAVARNGLVNMPAFSRVEVTDAELAQIADWLARPKKARSKKANPKKVRP